MCGIVAYIGEREAFPIVLKGLKRLEYRGYDSSGIAINNNLNLNLLKKQGKVAELEKHAEGFDTSGNIAIGHTRWATHGEPNDINAHPHLSGNGKFALVHNGIIENYAILKKELISRGHEFKSETDTEVLMHLIEDITEKENVDLFEGVRQALNEVHGAYAIVIISKENNRELIAARKSSPLVVGIGNSEFYVASDATPIVEYTKNVVYLEDGEIARLSLDSGLKIKTIANVEKTPYIQELEMQLEALEKGGYEHFMLKEIFEQPRSIMDCMRGRINLKNSSVALGGIKDYEEKIVNANV